MKVAATISAILAAQAAALNVRDDGILTMTPGSETMTLPSELAGYTEQPAPQQTGGQCGMGGCNTCCCAVMPCMPMCQSPC